MKNKKAKIIFSVLVMFFTMFSMGFLFPSPTNAQSANDNGLCFLNKNTILNGFFARTDCGSVGNFSAGPFCFGVKQSGSFSIKTATNGSCPFSEIYVPGGKYKDSGPDLQKIFSLDPGPNGGFIVARCTSGMTGTPPNCFSATSPLGICSPSGSIPYAATKDNCKPSTVWAGCSSPNTIKNAVCVQPSGCPVGFLGAAPDCRKNTSPNGEEPKAGDYILLQELPCTVGEVGCTKDANGNYVIKSFDPSGTCKLADYLNLIINLIIGLCAAAAVVMIIIGGVEYTTSELMSGKEAAKDRIRNAVLGLVLALGAYTLLYTINPDLLRVSMDECAGITSLSTEKVSLMYLNDKEKEEATPGSVNTVSGIMDPGVCNTAKRWGFLEYLIQPVYAFSPSPFFCSTIDENGGLNDLNGCGAAIAASNLLGQEGKQINPALLLALYGRETAGGDIMNKPERWCTPYGQGIRTSNMAEEQRKALIRLYDNLSFKQGYENTDFDKLRVSCVAIRNGGTYGHGGGLGHLQVMPDNWEKYGAFGNPNNILDSMLAASRLILANGNPDDIKNAACKYYSGHDCSNVYNCDDSRLNKKPASVSDDAYGCWVKQTFDRVSTELKGGASCSQVMDNLSRIEPPEGLIDFIDTSRKPFDPSDILENKKIDPECYGIGAKADMHWTFENVNLFTETETIMRFNLPEGTDYVSSSGAHVEGKSLTFLLGNVSPNEKKNVSFTVKINKNAKSSLVFSGTTTYKTLRTFETAAASTQVKICDD